MPAPPSQIMSRCLTDISPWWVYISCPWQLFFLPPTHIHLGMLCIMSMTAVLFTPHPHTPWYVMYHVHDSCSFYPPPTYTLVCYVSCPWQLFFLPPPTYTLVCYVIMSMTAVLFTPPPTYTLVCYVSCPWQLFFLPPTHIMSMTAVLFTPHPHTHWYAMYHVHDHDSCSFYPTPTYTVVCIMSMTAVLFTPHPHRPWYIMSMTLTAVLSPPPPPHWYVSCQLQLFFLPLPPSPPPPTLVYIMSMTAVSVLFLGGHHVNDGHTYPSSHNPNGSHHADDVCCFSVHMWCSIVSKKEVVSMDSPHIPEWRGEGLKGMGDKKIRQGTIRMQQQQKHKPYHRCSLNCTLLRWMLSIKMTTRSKLPAGARVTLI